MSPIEQIVAKIADDDPTMPQLELFAWREYARPRFGNGSKREEEARQMFVKVVDAAYGRMYADARRSGERLDFSGLRLRLLALAAMEKPCTFCAEYFGVEQLAFCYDLPMRTSSTKPWHLPNIVTCDQLCSVGKGSLAGIEFRDVMQALRAAEASAGRAAREALAAGRLVVGRRRRTSGSSPGVGPRG